MINLDGKDPDIIFHYFLFQNTPKISRTRSIDAAGIYVNKIISSGKYTKTAGKQQTDRSIISHG